jgi:hypothetical protein
MASITFRRPIDDSCRFYFNNEGRLCTHLGEIVNLAYDFTPYGAVTLHTEGIFDLPILKPATYLPSSPIIFSTNIDGIQYGLSYYPARLGNGGEGYPCLYFCTNGVYGLFYHTPFTITFV